jgi:peroxiredoxin
MKQVGDAAPKFALANTEGNTVALEDLVRSESAVVAFFKVGCPTCQYTFPFLERLHRAFPGRVVGVSQDSAKDTKNFASGFGITFPLLLDADDYKASRAYALTIVPSIFLIEKGGKILFATEGWAKDDMQLLAAKLADKQPPPPIFKANESVQAFKAG